MILQVANFAAIGIWVVGDGDLNMILGRTSIGEGNERISTSEGIKVVVRITFHLGIFPNLSALSVSDNLFQELRI